MAKKSAGILLYRLNQQVPEVLIVHPGGPYWVHKDSGAWSIPKGEFTGEENPEAAAFREFEEETGFPVSGDLIPLSPVRLHSGKILFPFAYEGDFDPCLLKSNTFAMEWPPKSGKWKDFPEVDRAEWVDWPTARQKLSKEQVAILEELALQLNLQ